MKTITLQISNMDTAKSMLRNVTGVVLSKSDDEPHNVAQRNWILKQLFLSVDGVLG